jgi:hypothetical protein
VLPNPLARLKIKRKSTLPGDRRGGPLRAFA